MCKARVYPFWCVCVAYFLSPPVIEVRLAREAVMKYTAKQVQAEVMLTETAQAEVRLGGRSRRGQYGI